MTEADIEKARVVKYAVATEDNTQVFIKVAARGNNGQPTPLQPDDLAGLKGYLADKGRGSGHKGAERTRRQYARGTRGAL